VSSVALQRVLVRMLYDTDFARRAIAGEEVLPEIEAREREWIQACDSRPFRIDPFRRSRSLTALFDEYPASCAWIIRHGGGVASLDAFFSDPGFHAGIQAGRSIALLFGDYQCAHELPTARALGRLERSLARSRRGVESVAPATSWRLARGVQLLEIPRNTAAMRSSVLEQLEGRSERVLESDIDFVPPIDSEREYLMVRNVGAGELQLESLTAELFRLLSPLEVGASWKLLRGLFAELELGEVDGLGVLDEFVESGEVRRPREA